MSKSIRFLMALAMLTSLAGSFSFAQSGEAVYKAKCQSCHGATGVPNPGIAKVMGVKPITAETLKKMSEVQMIAATRNGVAKMPAFKGKISEAEIAASVKHYRSLAK